MARALLIAMVALLLAPDVLAGGAVWELRRLPILDYTAASYAGVVDLAVQHYRAIMPKRGPSLRYKRMPERPCGAVKLKRKRHGVVVCNVRPGERGDFTLLRAKRHVLGHNPVIVKLLNDADVPDTVESPELFLFVVEHELAHALLGAPEGIAWNVDLSPGGDAERFAKRVYRKHGREH